ncbi:MAG TPA: tRNA dihydrouridine synthase DusB [Burkholderiales bacterium]|nr:tRNA dihydrouridine synthase DusB [Burkholderiales bacterium]
MRIGAHVLANGLLVAPMAGITDRPFRRLARRFGAALAVSEMLSARPELRDSRKSRHRRDHSGEAGPISVQIAGADPAMLADAARFNVDEGAQIIDINMGCPAKKVCNVSAGSALLEHEGLVERILRAVVRAVPVPVTLKIRTGPHPGRRNAVRIARIAESEGVQLLAIHGRTRACGFGGSAEYETIREVKAAVRIPVVANGDIRNGRDARRVLERTGADGIMVGRAAQGRPWVFREIAHFLATGEELAPPSANEMREILTEHLQGLYSLYGEPHGARIARKHIGWAVAGLPGGETLRRHANAQFDAGAQMRAVCEYFDGLAANDGRRVAEPILVERLAA